MQACLSFKIPSRLWFLIPLTLDAAEVSVLESKIACVETPQMPYVLPVLDQATTLAR